MSGGFWRFMGNPENFPLFKVTVRNSLGGGTSEYAFRSGRFTIGRTASCDIVLDSERVSRTHAAFVVHDGGLLIKDLGSANGVIVNDVRIAGIREIRIDDVIRIGEFVLTVSGARLDDGTFLRLKGTSAGFEGTVLCFDRSPSLVGRAEDADVAVVHPSISRRHARVIRRHDKTVVINDLGSSNGVEVNGVPVKVVRLAQGDQIRLGSVEFVVELPNEATLSQMPSPIMFHPLVLWAEANRWKIWAVAILIAAVAVTIAGWKIGGIASGR